MLSSVCPCRVRKLYSAVAPLYSRSAGFSLAVQSCSCSCSTGLLRLLQRSGFQRCCKHRASLLCSAAFCLWEHHPDCWRLLVTYSCATSHKKERSVFPNQPPQLCASRSAAGMPFADMFCAPPTSSTVRPCDKHNSENPFLPISPYQHGKAKPYLKSSYCYSGQFLDRGKKSCPGSLFWFLILNPGLTVREQVSFWC